MRRAKLPMWAPACRGAALGADPPSCGLYRDGYPTTECGRRRDQLQERIGNENGHTVVKAR